MKNLYQIVLILLLFFSCNKDKGNYEYQLTTSIDNYNVSGIDSIIYADYFNDFHFKIDPTITTKEGKTVDDSLFNYSWIMYGTSISFGDSTIIGTKKILDTTYTSNFTSLCYFKATEKKTGESAIIKFRLSTSNIFKEGYFLLTERANGNSRVQLISHFKDKDTLVKDVSDLTKSDFPMDSPPIYIGVPISYFYYDIHEGTPMPLLITEKHGAYLTNSFEYNPIYDLNNNSEVQFSTFKGLSFYDSYINAIMSQDGNIYPYLWNSSYLAYIGEKINNFKGKQFTASKFIAIRQGVYFNTSVIIYDEDDHQFLRIPDISSNAASPTINEFSASASTLFNFKDTSKSLVYMESSIYSSSSVTAILKDNSTGQNYFTRFSLAGVQKYFLKMNDNSIKNATMYAIDPNYGYLLYATSDNKLYEYDPTNQTTTLLEDYGNKKISLLKNQYFLNTGYDKDLYTALSNGVYVGIYDESDKENSGELYVYNITAANQPFTEFAHYKGLGKIVGMYHTNNW